LNAQESNVATGKIAAESEQQRRIGRIIREYDAQGWHRTGSETDNSSAEWLAGLMRLSGLQPVLLEPFPLSRIEPQAAYIEIDNRRISGLPLFDGAFTGPEGLDGRLGPLASNAEITFCEVPSAGPVPEFEVARSRGKYKAIVTVTRGRRPGLAPRNAEKFSAPFGPVVLQLESAAGDWLAQHSANASKARIVAQVRRIGVQARNVIGTLRGRSANHPALVVMTPRSGWWNCASERGGGIACWLEIIRALVDSNPARDVLFVATSGHELGHLGLEHFLERRPRLARGALSWVHLGASIGAAQEPRLQYFASDDELERTAVAAMEVAGARLPEPASRGTVPAGEARNVHELGGRYFSVSGGNALFHLETDRWPAAVDVGVVSRYANAFASLTLRLAKATSA
jgi:hypothetical protein